MFLEAQMADLLIRDLNPSALEAIAKRAAVERRSIEAVARDILETGLKFDPETRRKLAETVRAHTSGSGEDSTAIIRALRDGRQ
jgi:plasmid stability protein